jgi:hypothetical protein
MFEIERPARAAAGLQKITTLKPSKIDAYTAYDNQ